MQREPINPERVLEQTPHMARIREFMVKARQDTPEAPVIPDAEIRRLRARLILEEAFETVEALGVDVSIDTEPGDYAQNSIPISKWLRAKCKLRYGDSKVALPNLKEVVDGCADISVVTIGTLIAFGVRDVAVLEEVDGNNLAKFGPGGYRDEGGKWIKPPDHEPPRVQEIVDLQTVAAASGKFPAGVTFEDEFKDIKENAERE